MLASVCRTRTCSFEEVIRVMLTEKVNSGEVGREAGLGHNKFLMEIDLGRPLCHISPATLLHFWITCRTACFTVIGMTNCLPMLQHA